MGCGAGQLAKLLINKGYKYLKGVDFSKEAILLAKKNNIQKEHLFEVKNLYDIATYKLNSGYNTVIVCEVLEHLDDLKILSFIPSGTLVIFSVPNFNSTSHLRFFKSPKDIFDRYEKLLNIISIEEVKIGKTGNLLFIAKSIRK